MIDDPANETLADAIQEAEDLALGILKEYGFPVTADGLQWEKEEEIISLMRAKAGPTPFATVLLGDIERLRTLIADEGYTAFVALRAFELGEDAEFLWTEYDDQEKCRKRRRSYTVDDDKVIELSRQGKDLEWIAANAPLRSGTNGKVPKRTVERCFKRAGLPIPRT